MKIHTTIITTLLVITSTLSINHGYDHNYPLKNEIITADTHTFRKIVGSFDHALVHWADSSNPGYFNLTHALSSAARILKTAHHVKHLPPIIEVDLKNPVNHQHDAQTDSEHTGEIVPLNSDLAKFYQIQEVPTLTFFKEGNPFPFHPRNFTSRGISHTLRHMSKPLIAHIEDDAALEKVLKDSYSYKVIYFGPEHHDYEEETHPVFRELEIAVYQLEGIVKGEGDKGTEQEMVEFYYTTCSKMWKNNGEYSMTVFKPHYNGKSQPIHFEGVMHSERIIDHVVESIWPDVMTFSGREGVTRLYGDQTGGENDAFLVLFTENFEGESMKIINRIAKEQKQQFGKGGINWNRRKRKIGTIPRATEPLIFARSGYGNENPDIFMVKFAKMMGARDESIWLGKVTDYNLVKFKYSGPITYEGINEFIQSWRDNTLVVHYKSEPIPEEQPVKGFAKKIVADNYVDEVINNDKYVLVLYHERFTRVNREAARKFWFAFADKMVINKENLKIVYIDCDENDIPVHKIQQIPQVRLYVPEDKEIHKKYYGHFDADNMEQFLRDNMGPKFIEATLDL